MVALEIDFSLSEEIASEDDEVPIPDAALIRQWARTAFLSDSDRIASVQIMSSSEIQHLNRDWRGKDTPTNVLSFPVEINEAELCNDMNHVPLGDLALCAQVINREASEQGKLAQAHWAHMVVHGMLHLQGYDHVDDDQAVDMETLETKLLQQLGFENPY